MKKHYRSVFISDIHLGTKGCKAELLDNFLSSIECDHLFLVGDIFDFWAMQRGAAYFPQSHVNVVRRFLNKARKGTKVKYIIGNHDETFRQYMDYMQHIDVGNIEIGNEFEHVTADGKRLWITHGDLYDGITRYHAWVSHLGDMGYSLLIGLNRHFNTLRKWFGAPYWSLSAFIKNKVKRAVEFINSFEDAVAHEAKKRGVDGVVCGHIHHAEIKPLHGITYYNDGDWVESCTALVEHEDGKLEILTWHTISHEDSNSN